MPPVPHLYHLELVVSTVNGTEKDGLFVDVASYVPGKDHISEGAAFRLLTEGYRANTEFPLREWKRAGQSSVGYENVEDAVSDAGDVASVLAERVAADHLDPGQVVMLLLGPTPWKQATLRVEHVVWFSVNVWKQQPTGGNDLLARI